MIQSGNRNRSIALTLASALLAGVANASAEDKPVDADAQVRSFIETSYLIAPEQVGDLVIDSTSYDEGNKYAGAGLRYALKDHQEIRFDVYVYPAGRMGEAEAVERGMAEFKASFGDAEKAGYYRDVQILDESDFPLQLPDVEADPTTPTGQVAGAPEPVQAALVRTLLEGDRHVGRRLKLRFDLLPRGMSMYSDGYLFYKQLYFFKVRISAARERIDEDSFQSIADQTARALVPAIQVANIGGCANAVIEVNQNASSESIAETLVTQGAARLNENCYEDATAAELTTKSKGARVIDIKFDANDWKGQ